MRPIRTAFALLSLLLAGHAAAVTDVMTGREAVDAQSTPLPGQLGANVLWDLTHGVYYLYEPSGLYSELVADLAANGLVVATTTSGVDNIDLSAYSILVICAGSSWTSAYTASEVAAIVDFVNGGKGLLILGDNATARPENINPVAQAFGTTTGVSTLNADFTFTDYIPHALFDGVNAIQYATAGELDGQAPAIEAAFSDAGKPLVTVVEPCKVVVTGDINFADNEYNHFVDNRTFSLNIFQWLSGGCVPTSTERATWGKVKGLYR